ncbi:hypothetical protein [Deinococcus psychrotolerans]|nr:hypothetical protein [Deinococcus psychrotolerans]
MRSTPKPPAFWQLIVETYLLIRMGVTRSVLILWSLLFSFVTLAIVFGK